MAHHLTIDDMPRVIVPEQPSLSSDGRWVAYVCRGADVVADQNRYSVWCAATDGTGARQITFGPGDSNPVWSPNGHTLAFLRDTGDGNQLWTRDMPDGPERQITFLDGNAHHPRWAPDGNSIAFTSQIPDPSGPLVPQGPKTTATLNYQADGRGWLTGHQHVHIATELLAKTAITCVTSGPWDAGPPSWSPCGTRLAFTAAMHTASDLDGRVSAYVVGAFQDHDGPQRIDDGRGMIDHVGWTDHDDVLLLVGRRDTAPGHATLFAASLVNRQIIDLSGTLDRNVMIGATGYPGGPPQVQAGSELVLFCARSEGRTQLYEVPLSGGDPRLFRPDEGAQIAGFSVSQTGTVAIVRADPTSFGEIVAIPAGMSPITCTRHGEALLAEIELIEPRARMFEISDRTTVEAWIITDEESPGPKPLLVDLHGGPHNAWNGIANPVHLYHQVLASLGWSVLLLNPRGSDGYGEEFYTAAVGRWGEADARDILEPIDALVADGTADAERLAVAGYSYGGFMTCHLTSCDSRFAAAVAGGLVCDLTSLAGTTDIGHRLTTIELGSTSWADPERFARLSPISHVTEVTTPTLVLHGASDVRCPVGQAQQWFTALREKGVTTQMVLYPDAAHSLVFEGRPSHRMDYNDRIVEWLQAHANPRSTPPPT